MGKNFNDLNDTYFDILKELGNIGSGNAVTSLAKMLDRKIDMMVPSVKFLDFATLAGAIGGPENYVAGVLVSLSGDLRGIMMFLVEHDSAIFLLDELFFGHNIEKEEDKRFGDMEKSALLELGNILTNSYLNSLSDMLDLEIKPTVPSLAIDMAGAILSVPAIEFGKVADHVLFIDTVFATGDENINGYFILVPEFDSFQTIMENMGVS